MISKNARSLFLLVGLFLVALAALVVTQPVLAQENPDVARGFSAEKLYQFGEVDSVNLFNGNLTLAVPMGPGYSVNGNLSYKLTLTYNSNIWRFETREWQSTGYGGQTWQVTGTGAYVDPLYNAGPGWKLSLGQLLDPGDPDNPGDQWSYEGEDGSQHAFYGTLHNGDSGTSGVWYTRDGSYLRLKQLGGGHQFIVEFPDGSRRSFFRPVADWTSKFRIQWIEDAFGNRLTVTEVNPLLWQLSDSHRTHEIHFVNRTIDGRSLKLVDRVELAQFGSGQAIYQFNYVANTIDESCEDDAPASLTPSQRSIWVLDSVTLPDTSQWRMPAYYTSCTEGSGAEYSAATNQPGVLKKLVLPTLGAYEWTYQSYSFPGRVNAGQPGLATLSTVTSAGVRRKKMLNASGGCFSFGEVGCEWWYAQERNWPALEHATVVTHPNGDESKSYFDVHFRVNPSNLTGWEYGLPFTTATTDGAGRYLSQEIYDGPVVGGTKKRSIYVRYERDVADLNDEEPHEWENLNRRVASQKTVYHDDGGKHRTMEYSDFDGLGHYRTQSTSSSLPGGSTRTETTRYNDGLGSYNVNVSTNTVTGGFGPWVSPVWVLNTFTEKRQTEGSATSVQQYCFDATKGVVKRERVLKGTSPGTNDVIREYERDQLGKGNVIRESHYGGDLQTVGTSALCSLALPADRYRKENTYEHGTLASSRWVTSSGGHVLWTYRGTVDANTGLPVVVTGVDDLTTTLSYDSSGRLVSEIPQSGAGARTTYVYSKATSASSLAQVLVRQHTNSGGAVLTQQRVVFDEFGRPWRDSRLEASGDWSSADTVTNAMGWKHAVSERMLGYPSKQTVYKQFDPFGRPGRIEPPDDANHRILMWYAGDREVTRQYDVCSSSAGCASSNDETSYQTTERYDKHGRLYQVIEPSGAGGALVATTYTYDEGNRLYQATTSYGGTTQTRRFTYDNRGFLSTEQHPEKGPSGNGSVTYSLYDPLGNPGRKQDGPYDLRYAYDRAARLTNVDEVDSVAGWRPLKDFTFAPSNSGSDRRQGKLWWADRYNHITLGGTPFTVQVRETYAYAGTAGAVSQKDTQMWVNGGAAESFTQRFSWRDLGTPYYVDYPECTHAGCSTPAPRRVQSNFHSSDQSALNSVQDLTTGTWYATGISYHPNGLYSQVTHGNGVTDNQWLEASAMARPARIYTVGANSNWDSGTYRYDASGNVIGMASARYSYDGVSRLTRANTALGQTGGGTTYTRTYTYDAFANLTAITALSGPAGRNIPVNASTNRLSGASYDAAGNVTSWNLTSFEFDALGMVEKRIDSGGGERAFVYTADDERFWTYHWSGSRWTLRDLDGKVLRDYRSGTGGWTVERDYVYRDGQLLAAVKGGTTYHYHLDHLGTPRLITNQNGTKLAYHVYFPYGEEASSWNQDSEVMKFTGHERDFYDASGTADDLDYHHARYYNPLLGRYLGVDAGTPKKPLVAPQKWNRYSYARHNPMKFVDPNGLAELNFIVRTFISSSSVTFMGQSFKGDGRGFSTSSDASYRTVQRFTIETDPARATNPLLRSSRDVGLSQRATASGVTYGAVRQGGSGGLTLSASRNSAGDVIIGVGTHAQNPFAPIGIGPAIDNSLTLLVSQDGDTVITQGVLDGFPSTEVYVTNEAGQTVAIIQFDPSSEGNGPEALFDGIGDQRVRTTCTDVTSGYLPSCG